MTPVLLVVALLWAAPLAVLLLVALLAAISPGLRRFVRLQMFGPEPGTVPLRRARHRARSSAVRRRAVRMRSDRRKRLRR